MSNLYGCSKEAVRIKVKKFEGNSQPEFRKFSVDPQITSFEVLQSILAKAFEIKGDFSICYRGIDANGVETYLPLLSDWELEAAFLTAHNVTTSANIEPCLTLRVDLKPFEECSDDWEAKSNVPVVTQIRTPSGIEAKSTQRLHGLFNQMGKTFNMVQRAFNFGEDGGSSPQPPRPPLSDSEFRKYQDPVGKIVRTKELKSAIYFGGVDPSLRKVVWKHLLNVYPDGMTGRERMDYIRKKATEYQNLKETWKTAVATGPVIGELAYTTGMVRKDVLRTDRHHPFYAGSDDNQNIASLFNILTTYALNHPKVSYCQGMSDLASPLLVTMGDEAHAYICFCALMTRLSTNFMLDGIAMTQKFTHLAEGLLHYDPEFYGYLKSHQADDLLFCYRWLLLEMKREFAFDDSLRMLEVLWSSLPSEPPQKELKLFDVLFQPAPIATPPISPLVKTPRENAYTKVCALRRQSSSISLASYSSGKKVPIVKRQNHSLDESIGRMVCVENKMKHQSLDDATTNEEIRKDVSLKNSDISTLIPTSPKSRSRSVSPFEQKSDSVILNNRINWHKNKSSSLSSSMTNLIKSQKRTGHFKDLKEKIFSSLDAFETNKSIKEEPVENQGKMVKNFNEFLKLNRNAAAEKFRNNGPKITLTKSSFEESESSSSKNYSSSNHKRSSTSNSCDDIFDSSPEDSQDYYPMNTSITSELKMEIENLDRQVFSNGKCDDKQKGKEDVFIWENPLHQTSPGTQIKNLNNVIETPDEQNDLELDTEIAEVVDEKLEKESKEVDNIKVNDKVEQIANSCEEITENVRTLSLLPPPNEFGGGNPFLMFLCITVLLQHREHIMGKGMDYNEMAMHFDKMVRKHNVNKVLNQARQMYARYIKQHTIAQQKVNSEHHQC